MASSLENEITAEDELGLATEATNAEEWSAGARDGDDPVRKKAHARWERDLKQTHGSFNLDGSTRSSLVPSPAAPSRPIGFLLSMAAQPLCPHHCHNNAAISMTSAFMLGWVTVAKPLAGS